MCKHLGPVRVRRSSYSSLLLLSRQLTEALVELRSPVKRTEWHALLRRTRYIWVWEFTTHRCLNPSKLPWDLRRLKAYSPVCLYLTCNHSFFTPVLHRVENTRETCPILPPTPPPPSLRPSLPLVLPVWHMSWLFICIFIGKLMRIGWQSLGFVHYAIATQFYVSACS